MLRDRTKPGFNSELFPTTLVRLYIHTDVMQYHIDKTYLALS